MAERKMLRSDQCEFDQLHVSELCRYVSRLHPPLKGMGFRSYRCQRNRESRIAVGFRLEISIIPAAEPPHMDLSGDELAGIVELFGGLTREELAEGLAELAFKQGETYNPGAFETVIEEGIAGYHLISLEPGDVDDADAPVLVAGPAAFPELPEDARDLLHILDVDERAVDRETAGRRATERFRADAAQALDAGDGDRIETLIDVSYELETWGGVDLAGVRDRLD